MPRDPQSSQYWDDIVGNNWPEISNGDWSALADTARTGADTLDVWAVPAALRNFENTYRMGDGMQPVKDLMYSLQDDPQMFADALRTASDIFQDIANQVRRTRDRILNIVEEALDLIDEDRETNEGKGIQSIITAAQNLVTGEVQDAVRSLTDLVNPKLSELADELGQPDPFASGPPGVPGGGGQHPRGARPDRNAPGADQPGTPPNDSPNGQPPGNGQPLVPGQNPDSTGEQSPLSILPLVPGAFPPELTEPIGDRHLPTPLPQADIPTVANPVADGGSAGHGAPSATMPAGAPPITHTPVPAGGSDSGAGATDGGGGAADHASPALGGSDVGTGDPGVAAPTGRAADSTAERHDSQAGADSPVLSDGSSPSSDQHRKDEEDREAAEEQTVVGSAAPTTPFAGFLPGAAPSAPASTTPMPPSAVAPPPSTPAPAIPGVTASAAGSAQAGHPAQPAAAPPASPGAVAAPHVGPAAPAPPPGQHQPGQLRDAVAAAMLASAAPSFVMGESVDPDLVLARTLLGGVLAAVGDMGIGLGWAVAVLRGPGGIGAFVTSNEGRGWLPAGLYLPKGLSLPWVWDVSDTDGADAGLMWEGLADPARVLVEFASVWGPKSGARLSALVSSEPFDEALATQLGSEVPVEGSLGPQGGLDLTAPGAGIDRLGAVAAPQVLDQVARTPAEQLGARCLELASQANIRMAGTKPVSGEVTELRRLREELLTTVRKGRAVPAERWEELRDADELLAVSLAARRVSVSQVAVGDVRAETLGAASVLRGLAWERRADELVLLLEADPDRQHLRDATYAYAQITDHPLFTTTAVPTAPTGRPGVSAGPLR